MFVLVIVIIAIISVLMSLYSLRKQSRLDEVNKARKDLMRSKIVFQRKKRT
jgi:hypothetical protein